MVIRPSRYKKKPVEIAAVQFTGGAENATEIISWVDSGGGTASWSEPLDAWEFEVEDGTIGHGPIEERLRIETLEGTMHASVGDWIIEGVNCEFYPCKPDIFDKTYELVELGD